MTKIKRPKVPAPWDFNPSDADQRADPSAGAGNYWGVGIKQPLGRVIDGDTSSNPPPKKLTKPPKSLA